MAGVKGRSGGARPGSGPKRLSAEALALRGGRVREGKPRPPAVVVQVPVLTPDGLPVDQLAIWESLAPHATAAGTLVPATAFAFRELVEAISVKRAMLAQIQADGLTSDRVSLQMDDAGGGLQSVEPKAHPLIGKWTALMVRCEAGMARFLVHATGKPAVAPEKLVDEWQEFDGPIPLRAVK